MSDGDDRPKKSWREIDAKRDRGSGRPPAKSEGDRGAERVQKTAAYGKYKAQLDKLFVAGGPDLPESLKAKLEPKSPEEAQHKGLLILLREQPNAANLEAYLASGQLLPEDPRLLMALLDVPAALLPGVLGALLALVEGGKKPNRTLLLQKLDALITRLQDGEAVDLARHIRRALVG